MRIAQPAAVARAEHTHGAGTAEIVRDCQHPIARHQHGTRNAYVLDRCRCTPCRDANTAAERARTRAKAYGRYDGLVDAEPVRAHIAQLAAAGVGLKQITRMSGVSGGVLAKLVYGVPLPDGRRRPPSRRCTPRVRDRIIAVTPTEVAAGARVNATGTRRRLQALVAVGWSQSKLARQLGMAPANFGKTIRAEQVVASTQRAVAALYDQIWDTPPPRTSHRDAIAYNRARRHAAEQGWLPPLAWDDDTIDQPDALVAEIEHDVIVDEIAVAEAMAGRRVRLTKDERAAAVAALTARGVSAAEAARILGITDRTVVRRRSAA